MENSRKGPHIYAIHFFIGVECATIRNANIYMIGAVPHALIFQQDDDTSLPDSFVLVDPPLPRHMAVTFLFTFCS